MIVPNRELQSSGKGFTWLWRHCCLHKMVEAFSMKEEKGSKVISVKYHWCLTQDVGNVTIAGRKNSMIRLGGMMYTQAYMNNKHLFEAAKLFPWNDGDDTMAVMVLDPAYREALRATMGAKAVDDETCLRSFNHSGRRFVMGSRLNYDRSCSAREEHRMSRTLFKAVIAEWNCRGNPELRPPETRIQYYVHPTKLVNEFSETVTLPIASWYQATLGMATKGMLGIDRQKLAITQCFLLKAAWGNANLRQNPLLWAKKHRDENDRELKLGLGLKETIEKSKFAWLPNHLFNWKENTFAAGIADQFPFPIRVLEGHYQKRKRERKLMTNVLQEMDQIIGRINVARSSTNNDNKRKECLKWTATRVMWQYHIDFWKALFKGPSEFKGKETERKQQQEVEEEDAGSKPEGTRRGHPAKKRKLTTIKNAKAVNKTFEDPPGPRGLTYSLVKEVLEEDPMPAGMGKSYSNRLDLFQLIFQSEYDEITGQGWRDKPYIHCLELLRRRLNLEDHNFVLRRLWHLFKTKCHCIHVISRDRWLERAGKDKNRPGWIAFDSEGQRLDCSSFKSSRALQEGSSWLETSSMRDDRYWNMTIEDILEATRL